MLCPSSSHKRYLGSHLSVAQGLGEALAHGHRLGINALQVFLKNPNQWQGKVLSDKDIHGFTEQWRQYPMEVFAHSGYLINLAGDGETYEKSCISLADEMERADRCGIPYLVLHPGSHKGKGVDGGIDQVAHTIDKVYRESGAGVMLLIETMAGQGTGLGRSFEEIAAILDACPSRDKLGVCLDTCHIFAAGYDMADSAKVPGILDMFDAVIGIDRLKLVHLNDSKNRCGALVDRHEHIGKGHIGLDGFAALVNDSRIAGVPMVLETPKGKDDSLDMMNLDAVRSIWSK